MTVEADITTTLLTVCPRVSPDVAPFATARPYITWQFIGGRSLRWLNGEPADKVGCIRAFSLRSGDRLREQLLGLSDYDMFCTYSILDSPMPLTNYVATLRLTPITDQERTFIEWSADFDCAPEREAELVDGIGTNVFQGGFDALKRAFGG